MPSFAYTPGALTLTGGTFNPEPIRFTYTAGTLSLAGGTFNIGPNLAATDGDRLPRLQRQLSYFEDDGRPSKQMQQHWQRFAERIEQRFTDIEGVLTQIQQAQATAAAAVQTANATQAVVNLTGSYVDPPGVLTADSSGTITIAAHSRVYVDGTSVSVNAGSVSGFASGDTVTVVYVDPARAGGAVTYQGTTSPVAQTENTHVVGAATIPAVGQPDAAGLGVTAPGVMSDDLAMALGRYATY